MICPNCNNEIADGFTFCPKCGHSLPASSQEGSTPVDSTAEDTSDEESNEDNVESVHEEPAAIPVPILAPVKEPSLSAAPTTGTGVYTGVAGSTAGAIGGTTTNTTSTTVYPSVEPVAEKKPVEPFIPKEYKPLKTAGVFWFFFLAAIPVIGLITLICVSFGSQNKSRRSLSRAILIYQVLAILLICIGFLVIYIINKDLLFRLFDPNNWISVGNFINDTFKIVN